MHEIPVLGTCGICIPSKQLHQLSVFFSHNLGGHGGAPLTEQMRDLKILDSAAAAHLHPAFKFIIAKLISVSGHFHIYQLHRQTFSAHRRIQRRSKYRRQQHIAFTFYSQPDKIFHYSPVFFAEYFHMVIIRQTVRMKPFGVGNRHGGKRGIQHLQRYHGGTQHLTLSYHINLNGIRSGFQIFGTFQIHPKAVPVSRHQIHTPGWDICQQIRIKPRLICQIILIKFTVSGILTGHQLHAAHPHMFTDGGNHVRRCSGFSETVPEKRDLEGNGLTFQPCQHVLHPLPCRFGKWKYFLHGCNFFQF